MTEVVTGSNAKEYRAEKVGIQCELGSEVYYKYSHLYDSDSSDKSAHSGDFSKAESTESENYVLSDAKRHNG